jgi:hypothetical protein
MSVLPKIDRIALRRLFQTTGRVVLPGVLVVLAMLGTGCESSSLSGESSGSGVQGAAAGASGRDRYQVAVERAPFFRQGPAQGYGPDASLVQGTVVRMIERKYGYSRVTTTYGDGWMATSDLAPAPPEEPEPYAFADSSNGGSTRSSSSDEPVYAQPEDLTLPEPEPMPMPDPAEPQPSFRY